MDVLGDLFLAADLDPVVPAPDFMGLSPQRMVASGGRMIPRVSHEDGSFSSLQAHIGRNMFEGFQAFGGNNTTLGYIGPMSGMVAVGTATARSLTGATRALRGKRLGYVTASAAAGQAAGIYCNGNSNQHVIMGGPNGGGFQCFFVFTPADAAAVAGAIMFVGLRNVTAGPSAVASPETLTNVIGVAQISTSNNLHIVFGGSAAQAPIDLGANFPANGLSTDQYELYLYCAQGDNNKVRYRVERITTGHVASGTLNAAVVGTQLPAQATLLGPALYRANNATALAVGIDILAFSHEREV